MISILEYLLNELYSFAEQTCVQFLELGTSEGLREVITVFKAFDLDASQPLAKQSALSLLDLALQLAHGTDVGRTICARCFLVLLKEVVDDMVVFTTKVSITSTSKTPSFMERRETSKIPPPRR